MYAITSPVPQFFDLNGAPLDAGKIYIGTAGSNPETSPVTVYWDAAGTQPVAQPIRTVSGYLARNGRPARVYVSTDDFSITVKTRADVLVQSELSALASSTLRTDLASSDPTKGVTLINFENNTSVTMSGKSDVTGEIREALIIGPGTNPTGLICMDADVTGDYQPSPPSGPYGFHALEDKCEIDMDGFTNAYASYSVTPKIVGTSNYDHFKAVQAWPSYESSGNMTDFDVIDTYPNHSGSGTITNLRHFRVKGNLGSGPITNEYGLYIDGINRGSSSNFAIYSISAAKSFHYGAFGIGPGTSGVTSGVLVGGGPVATNSATGIFSCTTSQSKFGPADQIISGGSASETAIASYAGNDLILGIGNFPYARLKASGVLWSSTTHETTGANAIFFNSNSQSKFGPASGILGTGSATDTAVSTYNDLHFAVQTTSMVKVVAAGHFMPTADNTKSLGAPSNRWSTVYAGTGTIDTSDGRLKTQVRSLSTAERAVAVRLKALIKAFKFSDAVASKGDAARIHFGLIAQDVKTAFEAEGLDASKYALLCYDEWPDQYEPIYEKRQSQDENGMPIEVNVQVGQRLVTAAGNRYGVRYTELLAFVIGAM